MNERINANKLILEFKMHLKKRITAYYEWNQNTK